jgi:hypothetical protein
LLPCFLLLTINRDFYRVEKYISSTYKERIIYKKLSLSFPETKKKKDKGLTELCTVKYSLLPGYKNKWEG